MTIEEPDAPRRAPQRWAVWELGFRPFYLLASLFAALSIGLWSLQFGGWLGAPYLQGPVWHAHEMIFGFTLAVIVGFLFTAGRNWTNRPTPTGRKLMALAALWVAARVLVLTPFGWAAAIVNAAFPIACAIALAIPFAAAGNRRNYFFVALLTLLGLASLAVHLNQLQVIALPGWAGIQLALDAVLFILVVMGGRVIPMFTNNGVPGAGAARDPWVEKAALGSVLAVLGADAVGVPHALLAALLAIAAAAHLVRWALWRPWRTLRVPLVWVLHLAYAWIPVHLALRAIALLDGASPSLAIHALTAGAIGGLVIGMMTRTAKGHTARPLRADGFDTACYVLVAGAAFARVAIPLAAPQWTVEAILVSGLLWSAGFMIYFVRYWPALTKQRLDGKPG
ncbi:MAG TPA: NnrS family protein [Ramlibacter sp.]|nr:NnrS family protein [Ramlibacter sp.]